MITHIVLFKFENPTEEYLLNVVEKLNGLKSEISDIVSINAGTNKNQKEKFHVALTVVVRDFEALERYVNHPKHLEATVLIREKVVERSCVDYES